TSGDAKKQKALPDNRIVTEVTTASLRNRKRAHSATTNPYMDRQCRVRPWRLRADATCAKFESCRRALQARQEDGGMPAALRPDRHRAKQHPCRQSISSSRRA